MMGESIAQPFIGRPLVSVSGALLRRLRGHDDGMTEHQRHEQDRRANRPCTAWERAARTVPSTCHYRARATVCLPSSCLGTAFCKNWLKMDRYRRKRIGGVTNIRGQIELMHGFNSSGFFRGQVPLVGAIRAK